MKLPTILKLNIIGNILYFLVGLVFLIIGVILKETDEIDGLDGVELALKDVVSEFNTLIDFYIGIGVSMLVVSLVGFIGIWLKKPSFMIAYNIMTLLLLFPTIVIYTIVFISENGIAKQINQAVYSKVDEIISNGEHGGTLNCSSYSIVAKKFKCCDFETNSVYFEECCPWRGKNLRRCDDAIMSPFWSLAVGMAFSFISGSQLIAWIISVYYIVILICNKYIEEEIGEKIYD